MLPWPTEEERNRNSLWQFTWSLSYFRSSHFSDLVSLFSHAFNYRVGTLKRQYFKFRRLHIFCLASQKRHFEVTFWHQDSSVNLSKLPNKHHMFRLKSLQFHCRYGQAASTSTWEATRAFGESVDEVNMFKCSPTYWYIVFISWLMSASHASIVVPPMSQFPGILLFSVSFAHAVCVLS